MGPSRLTMACSVMPSRAQVGTCLILSHGPLLPRQEQQLEACEGQRRALDQPCAGRGKSADAPASVWRSTADEALWH
jgi:hypothetical protein